MQRSLNLVIVCLSLVVIQGCTAAPPVASAPTAQPSAIVQPTTTVLPSTAEPTVPTPALTALPTAISQAPQTASYQMDVRLDPATKTVTGSERITYRNPSENTLGDVWLHLYLKAFSSSNTLWMRESGGASRGF